MAYFPTFLGAHKCHKYMSAVDAIGFMSFMYAISSMGRNMKFMDTLTCIHPRACHDFPKPQHSRTARKRLSVHEVNACMSYTL